MGKLSAKYQFCAIHTADNTDGKVTIGDKKKLQDDIDKLVKWSDKWQMLFNFGKCKCLHTVDKYGYEL